MAERHGQAVRLEVAQFQPNKKDRLTRDWKTADGKVRYLKMEPFAITSISAATEAYMRHIMEASGDLNFLKDALYPGDICGGIFEMAITNYRTVSPPSKSHLALLTIQ